MKTKKIIRLLAAVIASLSIVMLTACGGSGTEQSSGESSAAESMAEPEPADPLVGQWSSEELPDYIYTFNADGTGQYDMAGNVLELTYSTNEDAITLTFLKEGYSPITLNFELDGDRLNIKDSFGKDTFYQRVKQ